MAEVLLTVVALASLGLTVYVLREGVRERRQLLDRLMAPDIVEFWRSQKVAASVDRAGVDEAAVTAARKAGYNDGVRGEFVPFTSEAVTEAVRRINAAA